jgi:hypothetical protein
MRSIFIILSISIIVLLSSCEREIDYLYKVDNDKLVITGSISPQEGVKIKVTHSIQPTGTYFYKDSIFIANAEVFLIINDSNSIKLRYTVGGFYMLDTSVYFPKPGIRYKIKVESVNYGIAESTDVSIPQKPNFAYIGYIAEKVNINGDSAVHAFYTLYDNYGEENYYYYSFTSLNPAISMWGVLLQSDYETQICGNVDYWKHSFFTDLCLDKPVDTLKFEVVTDYQDDNIDTFNIRFSSTNESLYAYCKNNMQPEGAIELAFSEPRIHSTNIKNGYGIFYGENIQNIIFKLPNKR